MLVHGAFADGSSWSKAILLLSEKGLPRRRRSESAHFASRRDRFHEESDLNQ
jgi:hypothetical protein